MCLYFHAKQVPIWNHTFFLGTLEFYLYLALRMPPARLLIQWQIFNPYLLKLEGNTLFGLPMWANGAWQFAFYRALFFFLSCNNLVSFLLRYHILVEVWHEGGLGKESKVSNVQSYSAMPADRKPFSGAMPPWARSWCLTCRKKVMSWGPRYDTFLMVCPWIYLSMKIFCLLIMMINMWRVVVWGVPYFIFTPGQQAIGPGRL